MEGWTAKTKQFFQVAFDTDMKGFNEGRFNTWMREIAGQVDCYLFPTGFLFLELYGAWNVNLHPQDLARLAIWPLSESDRLTIN